MLLADAYRACRDITRVHSKTFYLSSLFLAPAKRRAIWAVYAFCRTADDIADRDAAPAERLAALDAWERGLRDAYEGRPSGPVFTALADAAARFAIPVEPALDLLRGARSDVTTTRYATFEQLREYCYLVASTVGLLVLPVLGAASPEAEPYAVALGRAMQMTNVLRDVGEDASLGRVYLPDEDLVRFGVTREAIVAGIADERFRALMAFEIARVRAMYREAAPGIALLSRDARYTVRLALALYRGILARIEANGADVFTRRAFVPLRSKAAIALVTALVR
ncbi:MAG TPA: squalene/phytoene synthase family protein [Candidatus Elarobacter sp.]|nr:squalene/phytoene synthase family protein [Candidatus Elarobacter sp.]